MKQLYIQLTAKSPLAIRADHSASGAEAAGYIPGTAFIGSLAAVHRLLYPEATKEFEQLFLSEQVLYPDLYPAFFKDEGKGLNEAHNIPVYPLPRTAQSCKRHPGFFYPYPPGPNNDNHGVRDSLIDWAMFKLGSDGKSSLKPMAELQKNEHKECQKCKAAMDHFSGYYRRSNAMPDSKDMMTATIADYMRLQTHTGIDRDSGTVQEGILYNRKVFEEGMRFWGTIKASDNLVDNLKNFLNQVGPDGLVRIGTGRTRGMGKVAFQAQFMKDEQDPFKKFCDRLNGFHDLLVETAKPVGLEERYFFALTLHSPLILVDDFLRYQGTVDGPTLEKLLDCEGTIKIEQVYQSAQVRRVTGWLEIWGLPRMNEYAIETGSVFLFFCNAAKGTPANETLLRRLFELEEQGMGKRRAEGFGRVSVSDQFHQEREVL
jgi:CRISPR-associated protein Csx10